MKIEYKLQYIIAGFLFFVFGSCSFFRGDSVYFHNNKNRLSSKYSLDLVDELKTSVGSNLATIPINESILQEVIDNINEEVDLDAMYERFDNTPYSHLPVFTPAQVAYSIDSLESEVGLKYTPEVQQYIDKLTSKFGRKYMGKMLSLSKLYFPIFDKIFKEELVPEDLKYVAIIESALKPNVISKDGAVGLWQLMYFTGKSLGLHINKFVDERCSIFNSTRASAKYMRELYGMYGNWLLALAAYNCGPGNLNKAIRRNKGESSFWSISKYLPKETRQYIYKFIATLYTFRCHTDLMLSPMKDFVKYNDIQLVIVDMPIHLGQVASVLDIEEKDLALLNSNFLSGHIPAKHKKYELVLPKDKVAEFYANRQKIYKIDRNKYYTHRGKPINKRKKIYSMYKVLGRSKQLVYKVRSGDVLGSISRRFKVSVRQIKVWNRLHSDMIRVGQKLRIYCK